MTIALKVSLLRHSYEPSDRKVVIRVFVAASNLLPIPPPASATLSITDGPAEVPVIQAPVENEGAPGYAKARPSGRGEAAAGARLDASSRAASTAREDAIVSEMI